MYRRTLLFSLTGAGLGCGSRNQSNQLSIGAAANLAGVFEEIAEAFSREAAVPVAFSFGATALLAQQIANGAPFHVFAAADTRHPHELHQRGIVEEPAIYGRGRLALWAPQHPAVKSPAGLLSPQIRFVAIARPAAAPYGAAAVEALRRSGLWDRVQPKLVYAGNINMAREYVSTGSADAAITAWSLVLREPGATLIDSTLHAPLDQSIAVIARSPRLEQARRFVAVVLSPKGQQILNRAGYEAPAR